MTARQIEGEHPTLVGVLRAAGRVNADIEAYVEPATDTRPRAALTFGAWDRAADGVAGLLARHGVGPGTVVCLLLPSSIDYMVCYAAALRLGAITSGVNLRLGASEVTSILERTRPAVTVIDDGLAAPDGPAGTVLLRADCLAAAGGPAPETWPVLAPSDPVAVVWTSGTTGLPKGAVFDHDSLRAVAEAADVLSQAGDRRLSPLPFAHVGSMTRVWDEAANGVTTVIMGNCGFALAPCPPDQREWFARCLTAVEDIPLEAMMAGIDWNWETFPEYLATVDKLPKALNYGAYIGHSALRMYTMGQRALSEAATEDDVARMVEYLLGDGGRNITGSVLTIDAGNTA